MSDRYREHRVRTSLQHVVGSASDPDVVERLAREAYHQGRGVWFSEDELKRMPRASRQIIECEALRLRGPRR